MGAATDEQRDVYGIVQEANRIAAGQVKAGMTGIAADTLARSYIERRGHGAAFGHGLGHGLGIDIHEAPRLHKDSQVKLEAGMVVTVEPGIYLPDWGGIRIEDDVLVTPDGGEVLSHVPKSLDSVRVACA